jgi:sulfide:quinone oxidoreductase
MKHLVILGAGTGGTMLANRLVRRLPAGWHLTVVDPEPTHLYQPGLLFLPFGARDERRNLRPRRRTLASSVHWIPAPVRLVDVDTKRVVLDGVEPLRYDLLVIASGARLAPEETPGLLGEEWGHSIHEFYTLDGARALRDALARFRGGRLVVHIAEMPIKCPVAPLEFLFLADAFFTARRLRDRVELALVTPLDGAFTRKGCATVLGDMFARRGIAVEPLFNVAEVDAAGRALVSYDNRRVPYDLLVTVPVHRGAPFIDASGLGNELGFVPTHPQTLAAKHHDDVFVIGDAADVPTSKAGSVAHFESEVLDTNLRRAMAGRSLEAGFDGHANCFIESGFGKAILIDFNYDIEPLPGEFPWPVVGPLSLLRESRLNHWGKLGFRWVYWNLLLPGRRVPFVTTRLSMAGKRSLASVGLGGLEEA